MNADPFSTRQSNAELAAVSQGEREAIAAWRQLIAVVGDRYLSDLAMGARDQNLCGNWRDELVRLEASLKELEGQGILSDASVSQEKVWSPAPVSAQAASRVEHIRPVTG